MLALAPKPMHTPERMHACSLVLHAMTPQFTYILLVYGDEDAMLHINEREYLLTPSALPTLDDLQQLLAAERVDTYMAVVNMLRGLVA